MLIFENIMERKTATNTNYEINMTAANKETNPNLFSHADCEIIMERKSSANANYEIDMTAANKKQVP